MIFLAITLIHWIKYGTTDEHLGDSKFRTFYSGLRPTRLSRTFNMMFMIRRITFVLLMVFLFDQDTMIRIIVLTSVQFIYLVYLVLLRPFNTRKDNILEIVNEVGFFAICAALIYYYKSSRWNSEASWAFWSWIIVILSICLLVAIVYLIIAIKESRNEVIKISVKSDESRQNLPVRNNKFDKSDSIPLQSVDDHLPSSRPVAVPVKLDSSRTHYKNNKSNQQMADEYFNYVRPRYYAGRSDQDHTSNDFNPRVYPSQQPSQFGSQKNILRR